MIRVQLLPQSIVDDPVVQLLPQSIVDDPVPITPSVNCR
jgi:hypothetical protein